MKRLVALSLALSLALALSAPLAAQGIHSLHAEESAGIVPRYLLQDPNGRAVTVEDFRGRFQLITFGYTYCPDICPTTLVEMAEVLKQLGDDADRLQPIFVTVDPERDSGPVLQTYTTFFDPRIIGLTGSPALVRRAADNFKVRYAKVLAGGDDPAHYAVDHSAGMILLGPDGEFLEKFAFAMPVAELAARISRYVSAR